MNEFIGRVKDEATDAKEWAQEKVDDTKNWAEEEKDDFDKENAHREGRVEGWAEAKKEELESEVDEYSDDDMR